MKISAGKRGKLKYGSVSALMVALVLAGLIVLNVGASVLERKMGWRIDLSFNAIASQSPETAEILKGIDTPVKIWALYRKGDEDAPWRNCWTGTRRPIR